MTIEEKREKLQKFCRERQCTDCPVSIDNASHRCGRGKSFTTDSRVSDEEVTRAYKAAFGDDEINDAVNHPSHYTQGGIECIDAMVSAFGKRAVSSFCLCNAFKYIWRADYKNGLEDIKKANWYLTKYKELTADEAI